MGEDKREALRNRMFYLLNDEEEELKEKKRRELQLKREEEARRRKKIIVKTIFDLTEKYKDYDINVDTCKKIITLKKPLEVKYLAQFRYECNYLGFKCEIGNRSIEDMYYRNNYILRKK